MVDFAAFMNVGHLYEEAQQDAIMTRAKKFELDNAMQRAEADKKRMEYIRSLGKSGSVPSTAEETANQMIEAARLYSYNYDDYMKTVKEASSIKKEEATAAKDVIDGQIKLHNYVGQRIGEALSTNKYTDFVSTLKDLQENPTTSKQAFTFMQNLMDRGIPLHDANGNLSPQLRKALEGVQAGSVSAEKKLQMEQQKLFHQQQQELGQARLSEERKRDKDTKEYREKDLKLKETKEERIAQQKAAKVHKLRAPTNQDKKVVAADLKETFKNEKKVEISDSDADTAAQEVYARAAQYLQDGTEDNEQDAIDRAKQETIDRFEIHPSWVGKGTATRKQPISKSPKETSNKPSAADFFND